ncbi:hypothetical protein BU17DRAFT_54224 [Hysterangium stoloniferum]|nr:hypothetical protein BU17DRAFT_54224 [Hysterangium stoloniferum]
MAGRPAKSPRRLPTLTIAPTTLSIAKDFILSPETPEEYHTPLSASSTDLSALLDGDDKMAQDLAILEKLRRNVQMNLQLRPISSERHDQHDSPDNSSPSVYSPSPVIPSSIVPFATIYPESLSRRLSYLKRPLLIDTRNGGSYLASRIVGSVNIAIPSLILKRHRKPGANFTSIYALRAFITTDRGKEIWDDIVRADGPWDGDLVVYDEEMDQNEKDSAISWILLSLIEPLLRISGRSAMYLHGGITAFRQLPDSCCRVVSGERDLDSQTKLTSIPPSNDSDTSNGAPRRGLFNLDTTRLQAHSSLPDIERRSISPELIVNSPTPNSRITKPLGLYPPFLVDLTPSPPPSAQMFHRASQPNLNQPPRNRPRKPSVPNLRRIDTTSAERLPKLSLRTQNPMVVPTRATTLAVPPSASSSSTRFDILQSPSHFNLQHEITLSDSPGPDDQSFYTPATAFFTASPGPSTPRPHSPSTARPPPTTPTSELPAFTISCILPNFLFLGPELTTDENVRELQGLGVKRILNLAVECDPDDHGLDLRKSFERYVKIPMRDTVEEENIGRGVREVCECLDDARLHSSPTYVHCKAGKSRSVTAVMAYLIHANHWTLSKAYSFVLERRKGISPNIGFVSELMNFEEQELGGKSVGVVKNTDEEDGGGDGRSGNYAHVANMRRTAHMRESLPPAFSTANSDFAIGGDGDAVARLGDHPQELEIKDSSGRYRHQRRAPVDENTLQPLRRVSKAGLESGDWT